MYDMKELVPPFTNTGLINNDGTEKLAWYAWINAE